MVQGRWFGMGGDIATPLEIRRAVFGRGQDALDAQAWQVVVYDGAAPVGTARLWWQDGAFWLGDVGVMEERRGKGFGDLLVRLLLFKALTHSAALIRLNATPDTVAFFEKYGFAREQGATLCIRGQDVCLSHCGGACETCDPPRARMHAQGASGIARRSAETNPIGTRADYR